MWTSALIGAKIIGFFGIYGVSARTRGVVPMRTFCEQGEGVNFYNFIQTSFMDGPIRDFLLGIGFEFRKEQTTRW